MKTIKQMNITKAGMLSLMAISITLIFSSCAQRIGFLTSSVVPAAKGQVKVKKDNNENYAIQIKLTDLADVERLQPPKKTYVIWMVTSEGVTKNIGQLNSSGSLMSSRKTASFHTVTSFKPAKIFITAEEEGATQYPGSMEVLSTETF